MRKIIRAATAIAAAASLVSARAATITENFSTDPVQDGWTTFGNPGQFHWNSTNQNLEVTWDSSKPNSFFSHPLGTSLTRADDFRVEFDLRLDDVASGNEAGKTGGLEMGIGLYNLGVITNATFMRGVFGAAPNLAEFAYFPPGYYEFGGMTYDVAATTTPTIISTNSFDYAPNVFAPYEFELPTGMVVHVSMAYTAADQTLITLLTTNGATLVELPPVILTDSSDSGFTDSDDFRLDTLALMSYSSAGDDYDSVLAHGALDNISATFPLAIEDFGGNLTNGIWEARFTSRSNWVYTLERTTDFHEWTSASAGTPGNGSALILQDTNPPANFAWYRVQAIRP